MICKRCGRCCYHLDIFVVNPCSILPDGAIDLTDSEAMIFKPAGHVCPHLAYEAEWDENEEKIAVCTIHHLPCYRETPCEQFEQIGPEDSPCLMSGYLEGLK